MFFFQPPSAVANHEDYERFPPGPCKNLRTPFPLAPQPPLFTRKYLRYKSTCRIPVVKSLIFCWNSVPGIFVFVGNPTGIFGWYFSLMVLKISGKNQRKNNKKQVAIENMKLQKSWEESLLISTGQTDFFVSLQILGETPNRWCQLLVTKHGTTYHFPYPKPKRVWAYVVFILGFSHILRKLVKILGLKTLPKNPSNLMGETWIKVLRSFLKPKEWYDFLHPGQFGLEGRWLVLFISLRPTTDLIRLAWLLEISIVGVYLEPMVNCWLVDTLIWSFDMVP